MFWRKPNIAELEASKDIYGLAKVLKKRNHDYRLKALDSLSNLGDLSKPVIPEILNFYEKSYLNHEKDKSIESIYHIDSKLDSVRVWLQKRPSFENIVGLLIRLYKIMKDSFMSFMKEAFIILSFDEWNARDKSLLINSFVRSFANLPLDNELLPIIKDKLYAWYKNKTSYNDKKYIVDVLTNLGEEIPQSIMDDYKNCSQKEIEKDKSQFSDLLNNYKAKVSNNECKQWISHLNYYKCNVSNNEVNKWLSFLHGLLVSSNKLNVERLLVKFFDMKEKHLNIDYNFYTITVLIKAANYKSYNYTKIVRNISLIYDNLGDKDKRYAEEFLLKSSEEYLDNHATSLRRNLYSPYGLIEEYGHNRELCSGILNKLREDKRETAAKKEIKDNVGSIVWHGNSFRNLYLTTIMDKMPIKPNNPFRKFSKSMSGSKEMIENEIKDKLISDELTIGQIKDCFIRVLSCSYEINLHHISRGIEMIKMYELIRCGDNSFYFHYDY